MGNIESSVVLCFHVHSLLFTLYMISLLKWNMVGTMSESFCLHLLFIITVFSSMVLFSGAIKSVNSKFLFTIFTLSLFYFHYCDFTCWMMCVNVVEISLLERCRRVFVVKTVGFISELIKNEHGRSIVGTVDVFICCEMLMVRTMLNECVERSVNPDVGL